MSLQVIIQPRAERDIQSQYDYLSQRSSLGAQNWLKSLEKALKSLELRAPSCGIAAESIHYSETIREILFRTRMGNMYRALFLIRENVVHVLHVRGSGQDQLSSSELQLPG